MYVSKQPWSLQERLAAAILVAGVCVWPLVYLAERAPSTAPRADLSKQVGSTSLPISAIAIPLEEAPIDPRSMKPVVLAASKDTGKQDDAWGQCPAFTHLHALELDPDSKPRKLFEFNIGVWSQADGLCHKDSDDSPIKERPKLPKPKPNPKDIWL